MTLLLCSLSFAESGLCLRCAEFSSVLGHLALCVLPFLGHFSIVGEKEAP